MDAEHSQRKNLRRYMALENLKSVKEGIPVWLVPKELDPQSSIYVGQWMQW